MIKRKSKIEPGQCYRKDDKIYMVVCQICSSERCCPVGFKGQIWWAENTLTKEYVQFSDEELLTLPRPFQNFG